MEVKEEQGTTEGKEHQEGEITAALQGQPGTLPSTEFVKVEKNLASLGFFTPSSKRLRNTQEKTFTITTVADGKRMELKGTIIPSAKYGLPITADQDKWIALCKILTDILRKEGRVTNPISFTSADILRLLHKHRHSGKNYREIEEWLDVLFSTTIFSEGVVYLANEKRRVKDRFRVFERAVSFGKELPDGKVADKNYVWFSDWQLQNINSNHLLPIDLEAYRELRNHIAKALVPLLQVWLYATREEGVFEKRYEELCQMLNIRQYSYLSLITRTLGPSLDELKHFGYLADWQIAKTSDDEHYKIAFYHGEKFHRDRRSRLSRNGAPNQREKNPSFGDRGLVEAKSRGYDRYPVHPQRQSKFPTDAPQPAFDPQLVAEFTKRGITEKKTLEILANVKPGQDVVAQLELGDHLMKNPHAPIVNPPGFLIRLIESNMSVPESFETTAKRKAREENEQEERDRRAADEARQALEWEYDDYCRAETERFIAENPTTFESVKDAKRIELRDRHQRLPPDMIETMTEGDAYREMQKRLSFPTLKEFANQKKHIPDFFLKPVALLASVPLVSDAPPTEDNADTEDRQDIVMTDDAVVTPEDEPAPASGGEESEPTPNPAMDAAIQPATPVAGIQPEPESAKSEPEAERTTEVPVIELGPGTATAAPVETPPTAPLPPIGAPSEGLEQGMGQGLESSPYPPELPHGSQAA